MEYLTKDRAEAIVRGTISNDPGLVAISGHCKQAMRDDGLIINDLVNALKSGGIRQRPRQDPGTEEYKYRIETAKIAVAFKFKEYSRGNKVDTGIKLITCWRK